MEIILINYFICTKIIIIYLSVNLSTNKTKLTSAIILHPFTAPMTPNNSVIRDSETWGLKFPT